MTQAQQGHRRTTSSRAQSRSQASRRRRIAQSVSIATHAFEVAGYYPSHYSICYDAEAKTYTIALEGLERR